jgi:hypothetical protein
MLADRSAISIVKSEPVRQEHRDDRCAQDERGRAAGQDAG